MPDQSVQQESITPEKSVNAVNFRTAGRLSNENLRALTSLHDAFARDLSNCLGNYFSTPIEVKLLTIDQLSVDEHLENIPFYVVPASLGILPGHIFIECDSDLVCPMIELLMGGTGQPQGTPAELSEIDSEVVSEIVDVIAEEAEKQWALPGLSLALGQNIAPANLPRLCAPNEKLTLLKFGVKFTESSGVLNFLLPSTFVSALLKQIRSEEPRKKALWQFPKISMRERVLDCEMEVSAELTGLRVRVQDLIGLEPGSVLKLKAPLHAPAALTAGGRSIFEMVPVRNGAQRAAQLGQRLATQMIRK